MILIDGRPGESITIRDRGLNYGDGVFETLAVAGGAPLALAAHLERLARGCRALGMAPPDADILAAECAQVARPQARAVLKIIVTRGAGGRGYLPDAAATPSRIVVTHPWPAHPPQARDGIDARFCRFTLARQPALAGIKHLNRLEQVLARKELEGSGCAEGIVLDTGGDVIEGTMSNLFLVRNGVLLTPLLHQCGVAGIVRAAVLARCHDLGIAAHEQAITRADVETAQEIFFTNSVIGLWPVRRLETKALGTPVIAPLLAREMAAGGYIVPP
jgi:4-amino-4-deoxychorismate lyase